MRGELPLLPAYNHPVEAEHGPAVLRSRDSQSQELEDAMAEIPLDAAEQTALL